MNNVSNPDPLFQNKKESSRTYVCPKCGGISQISEQHYNALSDTIAQGWIIDVGLACGACSNINRFSEIRKQIRLRESMVEKIVENISTG